MQDLNDLYYFAQVVDHGGFAAAGRALGIQKSKLSRRVLQLEERLGARLIQRSSRRFIVTDIGRQFYTHCVAMLVEAEAAEHVVAEMRAEPRGVVRMSCPTALLSFQFGILVTRFMAAHPAVEVHLQGANRAVDVIAEGFDIAIRVRFPPLQPSDLVTRRLDESTQCLVASPTLVKGALLSPADLGQLPSLSLGPHQREHAWELFHEDGRSASAPHHPHLVTDDMATLRHAALAGLGVGQLPTRIVWEDIAAGRLVDVLPDWKPKAGIVHAVFPSRRGQLPAVRALLDFLAQACAAERKQAAVPFEGHAAPPDQRTFY